MGSDDQNNRLLSPGVLSEMDNPWAFGWTQLLAVGGLVLTGVLGGFGLHTLNRWRREKIEEKKIDLAMDAISLGYESRGVFEGIRSPLISGSEWDDMEVIPGEDPRERARRGSYYAKMKRIQFHREFFERAYAMQPRCSALFGVEAENAFNKLHEARHAIQIACEMLTNDIKRPEDDEALWFQLRADILGSSFASTAKEPKRVDQMFEVFRGEVERLCRPSLEANDLGSTVGLGVVGARARRLSPSKQIPAATVRRLTRLGPVAGSVFSGPERPTYRAQRRQRPGGQHDDIKKPRQGMPGLERSERYFVDVD
jgi:hypothetical protein